MDIATVTSVTAAAGALTGSWLLAAVALVEVVTFQWVWQARRGLTIGALVMGTRVARDDGPYSPGATRALVRGAVTSAGLIVAVLGAWVVAASSAWDHSAKRRSWADAVAGTVTARVPRRGHPVPVAAPTSLHQGSVPQSAGLAPSTVPLPAPSPLQGALSTLPPGMVALTPEPSAAQTQPPSEPAPQPVAPPDRPAHPTLLLTFDTGQRAQFSTPCAINLGRTPSPTDPGDGLISVQDPARSVSRTHLRVEHSRGRTWVIDGGSTNGSSLISDSTTTRLNPGERVELPEGDRVRMGDRVFTVAMLMAATAPEQETP